LAWVIRDSGPLGLLVELGLLVAGGLRRLLLQLRQLLAEVAERFLELLLELVP